VGAFRLPRDFYRRVVRLYPEERLFASPLSDRDGMVSYRGDIHDELLGFCSEEVLKHIPEDRFFPCLESGEASL
jgi:spore photoproduct lyase